MLSLATASFAAGLFDGEGHIAVAVRKSGPKAGKATSACLRVQMMDPRPLVFLRESFGGAIHERMRGSRSIWDWIIHADEAVMFARVIYPFSIVKKDEITVFLELMRMRGKHRSQDRVQLVEMMTHLRHRVWKCSGNHCWANPERAETGNLRLREHILAASPKED